jgi:heat shock protein HslJ
MVQRAKVILAAAAFVYFIGCSSNPSRPPGEETTASRTPQAATLAGTEWLLEDLNGSGVLDDAQATLSFLEGGRISGNGSCNRFSGSAEIKSGTIKVGPLAMTRMSCPPAVDDQEARYMQALQSADRIALDGSNLLLFSPGKEKPLKFSRKS